MVRFRLTHMQEAMLYDAMSSSSSRYVTCLHYELSENVNTKILKPRIVLLAIRHEMLRTSFKKEADGTIWQEVSDSVDIDFRIVTSYIDGQAKISPFTDKLLRFILCNKELIVIFHHALLDGFSVNLLMSELLSEGDLYSSSSPFRYYVKWLSKRKFEDDLAWWKEYLGDTIVCSELPNIKMTDNYERRELQFTINNSLILRDTARGLRVTAGRFIEAIWCMLMALYNGGESLVPCVISGRSVPVPGIMGMVGMCVNTLPIVTRLPKPIENMRSDSDKSQFIANDTRVSQSTKNDHDASKHITFQDFINNWSDQTAEAEKHGFCRLGDLIKGHISHILSIEPPFSGENYRLKSSNAELVTDFDAVFTLNDEINVVFAYNNFAYSDEDVNTIKEHFLTLLNLVIENPQIKLDRISILSEAENIELTAINENIDILNIIDSKTVLDFWNESVEIYNTSYALVYKDIRMTYAELSDVVDRLSFSLINKGVSINTPVAIMLPRSERYIITELAIMKAGGMFIPLDKEWPIDRILIILSDIKPFMIIDEDTYKELLSNNVITAYKASPQPEDAAYMIMTSGTTGTPKGVVVAHRNLANFCMWAKNRYEWQAGDSCALVMGFTFDGSMWDIWLSLISGGTLHILTDDIRFSISALGNYCKVEHITHIDLPVTMSYAFREIYKDENAIPDLRMMVAGGEEVHRYVPAPYQLSNEYGPTECTVCCSVGWVDKEVHDNNLYNISSKIPPDADVSESRNKTNYQKISISNKKISIGKPVPNMNVYILDPWGRLCPYGVIGEACFSGVQVALGYYNDPDLTEKRFTINPFAGINNDHKILYHSGDLMKWEKRGDDYELIYMGRIDKQVKVNGYRVELSEIENVLCLHSLVKAVTATIIEKGEKRIYAYVAADGEVEVSKLYELLDSKLPSYMRPTIVLTDNIPLTSSGKVDYKQLSLLNTKIIDRITAPTTENERVLISIVSQILGVSDFGINHNYLELGGNSINAMRIAFYLEGNGYKLTVKELIKSMNLAEAAGKMHSIDLVQKNEYVKNTFTPLSAQQAMIFLAETKNPALYTITLNVDAHGISTYELNERLNEAARLHDILRTSFELDSTGQIVGHIHDNHKIQINAEDFDTSSNINPLRDPLLNLKLSENRLILRYHHIAFDGFSINLLLNELLYNQFPKTAPSFAEFANHLAAQTKRQTDDEEWWRQIYKRAKAISILPSREVKEAKDTKVIPKVEYKRMTVCSNELISKCIKAAKALRVTKTAFMLSAWGVVINLFNTEKEDILIPITASCRDDDNLLGMCASAHLVKINAMKESFNELAKHVQDEMLESLSHWFVPQDIIGKMPNYLFVLEEDDDGLIADGEQNYDLIIKFSSNAELIYNALSIAKDSAKRIASYLKSALKAALLNKISVISEEENEFVTKIYANGPKLMVKHKTAAKAIMSAIDIYSSRIALITDGRTYTYSELYKLAAGISAEINSMGFGEGDIIAFNLMRDAEGIIAQIGITLSKAAFLPLDPSWPKDRINDILHDSGAAAVIITGLVIKTTGEKGRVPPDSAYIIYTSGTTGRPKGVIITQSALANQIAWAIDEFSFCSFDKMLHYIAFTFDPSVWTIFSTLSSGAALSLLSESARLDPDIVACHIMEQDITRCTLPAAIGNDILKRVKHSSLKTVFLGGEVLRNLPNETYSYEIINCYGPTEACINAAFYRIPKGQSTTNIIGNPVANTSCYVLDADKKPCPIGVIGELYIGGVQLAHGYLGRMSESEAVFIKHPQFGRIYKTGDRVAWDEGGKLIFYGRSDSQVKVRGNRVELLEIEHAISRIEGILDAKVKLLEDELYAYIIWKKDIYPISVSDVRLALSKKLPSYMLPRSIICMESFPLTDNGKIDYKALPENFEHDGVSKAVLDNNVSLLTSNDAIMPKNMKNDEPLSKMEEAIALAWKTALGLKPDYIIKRDDSFNDLGGHSLLLFHVVGLLAATGIKVDIKMLIEHPILMDLINEINCQKIIPSPKATEDLIKSTKDYKIYVEKMKEIDLSEKRPFNNVLITGGTGFLGSHLVKEIYETTDAIIHLPIRGDVRKLKDVLAYYFKEQGIKMANSKRIRTYLSDISIDAPKIDASIDVIYHAAADIRHYGHEHTMYSANVLATENMLMLARQHPLALFAHISTTSAVNMPFIRESDTNLGPVFDNIYQRTKQIAEECVIKAGKQGLKYEIFRIGHVSPGYKNGSVARNWEINAMLRLTNSMLITKLLPEQDYKIGYGYVDKIACAIRLLSQPFNLERLVFHIDNPKVLKLSEIFKLAGFSGNVLPKEELITKLQLMMTLDDDIIKQAASEYLGRLTQGSLEIDSSDILAGKLSMDATLLLLNRLGFEWPYVTAEYINNIVKSLMI